VDPINLLPRNAAFFISIPSSFNPTQKEDTFRTDNTRRTHTHTHTHTFMTDNNTSLEIQKNKKPRFLLGFQNSMTRVQNSISDLEIHGHQYGLKTGEYIVQELGFSEGFQKNHNLDCKNTFETNKQHPKRGREKKWYDAYPFLWA
jgi:hypothetical protein